MLGTERLFEQALGIAAPWAVRQVRFDAAARRLTIAVDFAAGSRFAHPAHPGEHPVHDTQTKRLRHLNFFQHDCHLEVRVPRVRLPDGKVALVEPQWFGRLAGFTLLFEALVLALAREMPFAAVARLVGESWHRVHAICERYVELAVAELDLSEVRALAIDETSSRRGHNYLTAVADAAQRRVLFVAEGRDAKTVGELVAHLRAHNATPEQIDSVSIDMSPAFIKGDRVLAQRPHHPGSSPGQALRQVPRRGACLGGGRCHAPAGAEDRPRPEGAALDAAARPPAAVGRQSRRAGRLDRQRGQQAHGARLGLPRATARGARLQARINVVRAMLTQWCTNVMRSKVTPMKEVAQMIRRHFDGIVAWTQTRQTNGFLEALNGLFQAAKRKARGYGRFRTMRTVIFLIAGKLDFARLNPHAA